MQIKDAKLETKNRAIVLQACDDLLKDAIAAVNTHKEDLRKKHEAGETVSPTFRRLVLVDLSPVQTLIDRSLFPTLISFLLSSVLSLTVRVALSDHI